MPNELDSKNQAVVSEIRKLCNLWRRMGNWFNFGIVLFGAATIITSIFVSVYTGSEMVEPKTLKVVAYISTVSLTLLTAFNLISYANNSRTAWRYLNGALMKFEAGKLSIEKLIDAYQKGEDTMGVVDFTYGPAASTNGQMKKNPSPDQTKQLPGASIKEQEEGVTTEVKEEKGSVVESNSSEPKGTS